MNKFLPPFTFQPSAFSLQHLVLMFQPLALSLQPLALLAQSILDKERRIADIVGNIKGLLARTK